MNTKSNEKYHSLSLRFICLPKCLNFNAYYCHFDFHSCENLVWTRGRLLSLTLENNFKSFIHNINAYRTGDLILSNHD